MKEKVEQLEAHVEVFADVLGRDPVALAAALEQDEAEAAAAALAEAADAVAVWSGPLRFFVWVWSMVVVSRQFLCTRVHVHALRNTYRCVLCDGCGVCGRVHFPLRCCCCC